MPVKVIISKSFAIVMMITIISVSGFAMWSYRMSHAYLGPPELPESTLPTDDGEILIDGKKFTFDSSKVETVRSDLFNSGYFSMFDVLVHLDNEGMIKLNYHFDEAMNTHIIDSLNEEPNWWYQAYYSGGWSEDNVFRPDHYPWKDGTTLIFYKLRSSADLESIYSVWREERIRRNQNNGTLIIPKVIIRGNSFTKEFENVEVTPHNLRKDVIKENVTTAIDVIMTLGDHENITYDLQWYESIGTADVVNNYWVERIDEDKGVGRCGFVYEAGDFQYKFFKGNHIHIPSDVRILNSPEYVEFFWICI